MAVEIYIPPVLQTLVKGIRHIDVSGSTVGDCLGAMIDRYPQFKAKLFTRGGKLRNGIQIFINKENAYPEPLTHHVRDGDKVYLSHLILGG
jgi:molybdopterin converting factor small subunit